MIITGEQRWGDIMTEDYMKAYQKITQGFSRPACKYTSPEEQGAAIQKCTLLKSTNLEYSNRTTIKQISGEDFYSDHHQKT